MNFHLMNYAQIVAWAEKQQAAIQRASQLVADLKRERERRIEAEKKLAAALIKAELAGTPKDDITAARKWRKMQEVADKGARV